MVKKLILAAIVILLVSGVIYLKKTNSSKQKTEPFVHYHAGFLVYVDGRLQDFTDFKYMNIKPCGDDDEHKQQLSPQEELKEKAHLHDGIGDVVHIHRPNVVWRDLFKNLDYSFDQNKKLTTYLNGAETNDLLSQPIVPYDSVIIISGDSKGIDIDKYVTKEHVEETEKKSENCGS